MSFLKKRQKKQENQSRIPEKYILETIEKSGWSRKQTEEEMEAAYEKYGIEYSDFAKYGFYSIPDDNRESKYRAILRNREAREECIRLTREFRNCSRKEAIQLIKEAKDKHNVSNRIYRRYHFYELNDEEQAERIKEIKNSELLRLQDRKTKNQSFINSIQKKTGWDDSRIKQELIRSESNIVEPYSFWYNDDEMLKQAESMGELDSKFITDYYAFEFWNKNLDEQKRFFTQVDSKFIADRIDSNPLYKDILLNKELSCAHFSEFMKRPWAINTKLTQESFLEMFHNERRIVYKPLDGHGGQGLRSFDFDATNADKTFSEISKLPRGIVEGFVKQHPTMDQLEPGSVNTVRIVTVSAKANGRDIINDFFDIVYAALRIGRKDSFTDNFSKGGLVAGVDKKTGIVETDGVDVNGKIYTTHPDTGVTIKGFQIPMFSEILEIVKAAGNTIDGYIGWDIAVTTEGPALIEANTNPGNRILQMPYASENKGMKHIMKKYLDRTVV